MNMDQRLHSHRLILAGEDPRVLVTSWSQWRLAPKRDLVMPQDLASALTSLSAYTGGSATVWLEALLLIDISGRLYLESTWPLANWFVSQPSPQTVGAPRWTVSDASVEMLKTNECLEDAQVGPAIRMRLARQLLGQQPPEDLEKAIDSSWNVDDAFLTIWLPDKGVAEMKALAVHLDFTMSDIMRNALFIHLWGRVGFAQCVTQNRWRQMRRDEDIVGIMFSSRQTVVPEANDMREVGVTTLAGDSSHCDLPKRAERIAEWGKSTVACKVWLPNAMKARLLASAQNLGLRQSDYCRDVIIGFMYGYHSTLCR